MGLARFHHLHLPIYRSTVSHHQNGVGFSMRLGLIRDLSLKRSAVSYSIPAFETHSSESTKNGEAKETLTEKTTKKEEKEEKKLPPLPEKPEPGDCCGSGCVRCVWDVYYEELDAYNKLCKSVSGESKSD